MRRWQQQYQRISSGLAVIMSADVVVAFVIKVMLVFVGVVGT